MNGFKRCKGSQPSAPSHSLQRADAAGVDGPRPVVTAVGWAVDPQIAAGGGKTRGAAGPEVRDSKQRGHNLAIVVSVFVSQALAYTKDTKHAGDPEGASQQPCRQRPNLAAQMYCPGQDD